MIQFRMIRINTEQFAILDKNLHQEEAYGLETTIAFAVNSKEHIIANRMKIEIKTKNRLVALLELVCAFEIHPESWNEMIQVDKIVVPKDTLTHLAVHTVGTARGILHCKTEGTPFNVMILPPLNVMEMVTADLSVPIDK